MIHWSTSWSYIMSWRICGWSNMSWSIICNISQLWKSSQHDPSSSSLEQQIFVLDCLYTMKDSTYCNMSHFHTLSSALKCKIRSIYPDCNHYIRSLLNKEVSPMQKIIHSNNPCDKPMYILWTRTVPMVGCSWWLPNHFVPCIPMPKSENVRSPRNCAAQLSSKAVTSDFAITTQLGSESNSVCWQAVIV